jgi:hypothetical protein
LIATPPEYVPGDRSVQVPKPVFISPVEPLELSTSEPSNDPVPTLDPLSVSVFAPRPVAVSELEKINVPEPAWSRDPPPVVPARLIIRSVISPVPTYRSEAAVVSEPSETVAVAALVCFPRLVATELLTLPRVRTSSVPACTATEPEKVFAPVSARFPAPDLVREKVPPPSEMGPERMSAEVPTVVPIATLKVRFAVRVLEPVRSRFLSLDVVGKVGSAENKSVFARMMSLLAVDLKEPPANKSVPVPRGPEVRDPFVKTELTVGITVNPVDNVVVPEYVESAFAGT